LHVVAYFDLLEAANEQLRNQLKTSQTSAIVVDGCTEDDGKFVVHVNADMLLLDGKRIMSAAAIALAHAATEGTLERRAIAHAIATLELFADGAKPYQVSAEKRPEVDDSLAASRGQHMVDEGDCPSVWPPGKAKTTEEPSRAELEKAMELMAHDMVDRGDLDDDDLDMAICGVCRDYVAMAKQAIERDNTKLDEQHQRLQQLSGEVQRGSVHIRRPPGRTPDEIWIHSNCYEGLDGKPIYDTRWFERSTNADDVRYVRGDLGGNAGQSVKAPRAETRVAQLVNLQRELVEFCEILQSMIAGKKSEVFGDWDYDGIRDRLNATLAKAKDTNQG